MSEKSALGRFGNTLLVVVLAGSALVNPARELCAAEPAGESELEEAKDLFRRGVALLGAGDTERALEHFLRSRALVPSVKNTANAAICLERLGRFDEALVMYEELLARFAADLDADDRKSLLPLMASLRQKIGYLELSSNVDGLVVVDGRARGRLPLTTALRLLPGRRVLRIVKDGYRTFERAVEVTAGASAALDAELEPLAGMGAVRIEGSGAPLVLFIDGERVGTTPFEGTFRGGRHVLRSERSDAGSAPEFFDVIEGKTLLLRVSPRPLGGTLALSSLPATAELLLGAVPLGRGPWLGRLPVGHYELRAHEPGYFDGTRRFEAPRPELSLAVRMDLQKDPNDPRWPERRRWTFAFGVQAGPWIAPTLNSGAEEDCPSLCAGGRGAFGGFGSAVIGARHDSGFGAELRVGYAGFRQRFTRAVFTPFHDSSEAPPGAEEQEFVATYALEQTETGHGPTAELRGTLRRATGLGFDFWSSAGAGVFFGSYRVDAEGEVFTTGAPVSAVVEPATVSRASPFVALALGAERRFGAVRLRTGLGAWFFPALGPKLGGPTLGVVPDCRGESGAVGCTPQSDVLAGARAHGPFLAFTPELGAEYSF